MKSKKQIDADHYKKKTKAGWFKFSKWMHEDKIEPISFDEIQAFFQKKAREGLKDLSEVKQVEKKK
jgi:hypothetical protein